MMRQMKPEDLEAVQEIENVSFKDPWKPDSFVLEMEKNPFSRQMVLEQDGKIAGYVIYWVTFENGQIANIAVDPALRGMGLGKVLLQEAIEQMKNENCEMVSLDVRVSNQAARKLYESFGFQELNRSKNYYGDEDSIVMGLGI